MAKYLKLGGGGFYCAKIGGGGGQLQLHPCLINRGQENVDLIEIIALLDEILSKSTFVQCCN